MLRGCGEGRASAFCVVRLGRRSSTAAAGEATSCSVLDIDRSGQSQVFNCSLPFSSSRFYPALLRPSTRGTRIARDHTPPHAGYDPSPPNGTWRCTAPAVSVPPASGP
eukprot:scaffold92330_cov71-Phaeocystis_antarctica.AAC.2